MNTKSDSSDTKGVASTLLKQLKTNSRGVSNQPKSATYQKRRQFSTKVDIRCYEALLQETERCFEYSRKGKRECKTLANLLIHWGQQHFLFAHSLGSYRKKNKTLSSEFERNEEQVSMNSGHRNLIFSLECTLIDNLVASHYVISDKLNALGQQLHDLRREQELVRTHLQTQFYEEKKVFCSKTSQVLKSQSKYFRACKEAEKLIETQKAVSGKTDKKLEQKIDEQLGEIKQLQAIHWVNCATMREQQLSHRQSMNRTLKSLESLDEYRIKKLKALSNRIVEIHEEQAKFMEKLLSSISEVEEQVCPSEDEAIITHYLSNLSTTSSTFDKLPTDSEGLVTFQEYPSSVLSDEIKKICISQTEFHKHATAIPQSKTKNDSFVPFEFVERSSKNKESDTAPIA